MTDETNENPLALIATLDSSDRAELAVLPSSELERAVKQGELWAQREDEACGDHERGDWYAIGNDALSLIDGLYDPSEECPNEAKQALAELCNAAAKVEWERLKTDTDLLTSIETHRERLAHMVARAPVQIVPRHTVAEAAMALAEEIVHARKRIPRVDYHVRDAAVRHAIAVELAECGYDAVARARRVSPRWRLLVDEFLDSIS